jgi:chitinase
MFQFLNYAPAGAGTSAVDEAIWNKWMRVSNWIDLVLYVFDNEYQWGHGRPGEPVNTQPGGTASMRSLYAYWIDLELRSIETMTTQWSRDAQTEYGNTWLTNDQQSGKNWFTATWAPGGMATAAQMMFPRPPTGDVNNKYGAYGYTPMTLDRNSNQVDIGSPTRI